jgi:hypothetical protein
MNDDNIFLTHCTQMPGVDYTFASLVRHLSGDECKELAAEYFEKHRDTTLPGETLFVDLRPAFQKPLADVTPKFYRAQSKRVTPPPVPDTSGKS